MRSYFARHTERLLIRDEDLVRFWEENKITVHYPGDTEREPDLKSLEPGDYSGTGKTAVRYLRDLERDGCYVGADEFDGYVVFTFPYTEKALLERPVYGNAIYVLGADWKRLSRLSKGELLADHTHGITKIVHRSDWFERVKAVLGFR